MRITSNKKRIIEELKDCYKSQNQIICLEGMHKSNKHRLIKSLVENGFLFKRQVVMPYLYNVISERNRIRNVYTSKIPTRYFESDFIVNKRYLLLDNFIEQIGSTVYAWQEEYINSFFPHSYTCIASRIPALFDQIIGKFVPISEVEKLANKESDDPKDFLMIEFYKYALRQLSEK